MATKGLAIDPGRTPRPQPTLRHRRSEGFLFLSSLSLIGNPFAFFREPLDYSSDIRC